MIHRTSRSESVGTLGKTRILTTNQTTYPKAGVSINALYFHAFLEFRIISPRHSENSSRESSTNFFKYTHHWSHESHWNVYN